MFVATQFIGLYVIDSDPFHIKVVQENGTIESVTNPDLSWIQPPEIQKQSDFATYLGSIIFAFIIAILILFLLTTSRFKLDFILRIWFFVVVAIALFITFNAVFPREIFSNSLYFKIPAVIIVVGLAFMKIFKRNFIVHNFTELLIYPGIASIFVPILSLWSICVLLLLISAYDIWAVWHSGIMQKMAKYQISNLKVFSGFFVPYIPKKIRMQLRKLREKRKAKGKKIKVNIAILGGGDIFFPIVTAGVILNLRNKFPDGMPFLSKFGFPNIPLGIWPALFVIAGATLGLALLFIFSEKKKFYPAMPFITAGIFVGMLFSYIFLS